MTEKVCTGCQSTLPLARFYRNRGTRDGYAQHCIDCRKAYLAANRDKVNARQRAYIKSNPDKATAYRRRPKAAQRRSLLRRYGLTLEEYDAMLLEQGGACAICGLPEGTIDHRTNAPYALAVDHAHDSGEVRGLLCRRCNQGLGLLGDTAESLRTALAYLERRATGPTNAMQGVESWL